MQNTRGCRIYSDNTIVFSVQEAEMQRLKKERDDRAEALAEQQILLDWFEMVRRDVLNSFTCKFCFVFL